MPRWRLRKRIANGSTASVFIAERDDPSRGDTKPVCIKVVPIARMSPNERLQARQEAVLLRLMKPCPSVVQIVESFEEHGALFIVTELAEHGNLAQAIHSRCGRYFAERVVLAWTGQLARAVAFVHGERILHRDIKTKNVLIDAADRIRLADFGAARRIPSLATRVADRLTSGRSVALAVTTIGTPLNMAPELLHGEAYGAPADMWATGCVMHQMLALAHPFASSTIAELVSKVIGGGRQALPAHLSRFSGTLVERMLQPNPSRRITAAQLAGVIEAHLATQTSSRFDQIEAERRRLERVFGQRQLRRACQQLRSQTRPEHASAASTVSEWAWHRAIVRLVNDEDQAFDAP